MKLKATMEELEAEPLIKVILCSRCGQPLTDPESIRRGMGPICFEREGGSDECDSVASGDKT